MKMLSLTENANFHETLKYPLKTFERLISGIVPLNYVGNDPVAAPTGAIVDSFVPAERWHDYCFYATTIISFTFIQVLR